LLKRNPNYALSLQNFSADYEKVLKRFKINPEFTGGIQVGIIRSNPVISKGYTIKTPASLSAQGITSYFYGISPGYFFKNSHFSLQANFLHTEYFYSMMTRYDLGEYTAYNEHNIASDIQLMLRREVYSLGKTTLYLGLGAAFSDMASSLSQISYHHDSLNINTTFTRNLNGKTNPIKKTSFFATGELMVSYKLKDIYLQIGATYNLAISNHVDASKRYMNPEFNFNAQWVDSDMKLDYYSGYISCIFPLTWHV
jgi:hypothetical protein